VNFHFCGPPHYYAVLCNSFFAVSNFLSALFAKGIHTHEKAQRYKYTGCGIGDFRYELRKSGANLIKCFEREPLPAPASQARFQQFRVIERLCVESSNKCSYLGVF